MRRPCDKTVASLHCHLYRILQVGSKCSIPSRARYTAAICFGYAMNPDSVHSKHRTLATNAGLMMMCNSFNRFMTDWWVRGVALYFSVLAMSGVNPKTQKVEKLLLTLKGRARPAEISKSCWFSRKIEKSKSGSPACPWNIYVLSLLYVCEQCCSLACVAERSFSTCIHGFCTYIGPK